MCLPVFLSQGDFVNAKRSLLSHIECGDFALCTDAQIAKVLGLGRQETLAVRDILYSLVREGRIFIDSRGRFGTAKQFGALRGTISGNERGFGFFVPEDGSGDLFLPHRALKGALHGDTVLAFRVGRGKDEGEVLSILTRGAKEIVGTYRREHRAGYVVPDEKKFDAEVLIPAGKHSGCRAGDKVVARITSFEGETPLGEIEKILGKSGELFTEEAAIIRAHHLHEAFPAAALKAAERIPQAVEASALEGRLDLRGKCIITVDGEDTRDIDDAISVSRTGENFLLGVHIADVSHYVKRGDALDREAFARGTSVYFPDRVLPMLPPALSNGICSLNEGADRLTLSCLMTVDRKGNVLKKKIVPSVICSAHRMTYSEVTKLSERDPKTVEKYPDLLEFVDTAVALTKILKDARAKRGGVALEVKEAKILYEDGKISIPDAERTISHEMIEQFMVLANESVAALMTQRKVPFVYRVHEKPSEEKAGGLMEFLRGAGIAAHFDPADVTPRYYGALLAQVSSLPIAPIVSRVMLRSMMKAVYSPPNIGHFGLASECYCHFTSPIRRYPDLCIHRIIKEALVSPAEAKRMYKDAVQSVATQSSATERTATDAERDMDDLYIAEYMRSHIGETFEATISGVTSYGLYAELKNTVEGFIPIETLPDDRYEFLEAHYTLRGTRACFRLGMAVRVQVTGVDFGTRKTQFCLLAPLRVGRQI